MEHEECNSRHKKYDPPTKMDFILKCMCPAGHEGPHAYYAGCHVITWEEV